MAAAEIYGKSFFELARDEGLEDIILSDLNGLTALFAEHSDYVRILDSPQIDRNELMKILNEDFFGRINRYTLTFLKLLCEKHMVHLLAECTDAYTAEYNNYKNIKVVNVTTASPMSRSSAKKLVEKLESKTGAKVVLKEHTDESCMGGIIIEMDGNRIDSSIKSELMKMKQALIN